MVHSGPTDILAHGHAYSGLQANLPQKKSRAKIKIASFEEEKIPVQWIYTRVHGQNKFSKEIFSIGKGGMRKKKIQCYDILHWYMAKKKFFERDILYVKRRHA